MCPGTSNHPMGSTFPHRTSISAPKRSSAHQHLQTPTCSAPRCCPGEMEQD